MSKVIITAALNGARVQRARVPSVPLSPDELADEAQRAVDAGASVIHVFAREEGGAVSYRVERCREVLAAIRARCNALVSLSTELLSGRLDDRAVFVDARPDLIQLPVASMTWARYDARRRELDADHALISPLRDTLALAARARELGVRVVPQCYDVGHVSALGALVEMGGLADDVPASLTVGVLGGLPARVDDLARLAERLPTTGPWTLVTPADRPWPLRAAALALGGHLRVGFEDGVRMPNGDLADSNGPLVAAAADLCAAVGLEPATVEEARAMSGCSDVPR